MSEALPLTVSRDGHVARLTIDRPDKRNAMTAAMWAGLPGVLDELAGVYRGENLGTLARELSLLLDSQLGKRN